MNYLPINQTILDSHINDCWAYYCYLHKTITKVWCNFINNITIDITIDAGRSKFGRAYADLGTTSWSTYSRTWEKDQLLILNTPTTMMPPQVFEIVHDVIMRLPSRSRNSYCRFYLTMYFLCHSCLNDYGISVERLATLLKSNTNDICGKIRFFIDVGLLRRMGKYNSDLGIPYRYFIPPDYCSGLN